MGGAFALSRVGELMGEKRELEGRTSFSLDNSAFVGERHCPSRLFCLFESFFRGVGTWLFYIDVGGVGFFCC